MHEDIIRWHITHLAQYDKTRERRLSASAHGCWPGGSADRTEPMARQWVRLWRPAQSLAALPACSCAAGRCAVCN